jgi:thioredoxin reductase (NADPH)
MIQEIYDVCIIGSGPSGLTSAIYASRAFLKTVILGGNPPGGQLITTSEVENFPGFPDGVTGPQLVEWMRVQAKKFNTEFIDENAIKIEGTYDTRFTVHLEDGRSLKTKTIIIATGASAKWLGLDSEQKLRGRGVSACATCDGYFFRNMVVAVVGGGDAAMEESIFLTKFATKVYVLYRKGKDDLRASKIMQQRALDNKKIEFMYNTEVVEVLGVDAVSGIKVINNVSKELTTISDVQGLFVAIGHAPNTNFLKGFLDLDEHGYVIVTNNTITSKKGVFVAGDVADHHYRQAITASGFGCMAAIDTAKLIATED